MRLWTPNFDRPKYKKIQKNQNNQKNEIYLFIMKGKYLEGWGIIKSSFSCIWVSLVILCGMEFEVFWRGLRISSITWAVDIGFKWSLSFLKAKTNIYNFCEMTQELKQMFTKPKTASKSENGCSTELTRSFFGLKRSRHILRFRDPNEVILVALESLQQFLQLLLVHKIQNNIILST